MAFDPNLVKLRSKPYEQPEWLIVGLGNPGSQYARTRHNVGFMCVNRIAQRASVRFRATGKDRADIAFAHIAETPGLLAEPQTYMNDSGQSVVRLLKHHNLHAHECLVICDDVDLPFGTVRIRAGGSSGGQRGLQSIIDELGTNEFPRVRVGIGRGTGATKDHVLTEFDAGQHLELNAICDRVADIVETIVSDGVVAGMNAHNGSALDVPAPVVPSGDPR